MGVGVTDSSLSEDKYYYVYLVHSCQKNIMFLLSIKLFVFYMLKINILNIFKKIT